MPEFFNKLNEKTRFSNTQLAFLYTHPLIASSDRRFSGPCAAISADDLSQMVVIFYWLKARIFATIPTHPERCIELLSKKNYANQAVIPKPINTGLHLHSYDNPAICCGRRRQLLKTLYRQATQHIFFSYRCSELTCVNRDE